MSVGCWESVLCGRGARDRHEMRGVWTRLDRPVRMTSDRRGVEASWWSVRTFSSREGAGWLV